MIRVQFLPAFEDGRIAPLIQLIPDRLSNHLLELGIDWDCDAQLADVVWACQHRCHVRTDLPVIVQDVIDWAPIVWGAREALHKPYVKLLVKQAVLNPLSLCNLPHVEHTWHGNAILESVPPDERPTDSLFTPLHVELTESDFSKVRLGYNWLFHPRLDWLADEPLVSDEREFDVFFAGHDRYTRWTMTQHRRKTIEQLEQIPGHKYIHCGVRLRPGVYNALTVRSKVMVSPWGYGETCIRDIEALLAGCMLVKPETQFIQTWPEYHNQPHVLHFRPDFSNFADTVAEAVSRFDELRDDRLRFRAELLALRRPEVLASRLANLVTEALT